MDHSNLPPHMISTHSAESVEMTAQEKAKAAAERLEDTGHQAIVKDQLKILLLHLAARSKQPSVELESLLHEVIDELHEEVRAALEQRAQLRLVTSGSDEQGQS